MLLEARNITIGYDNYVVQRDISCNIEAGSMICLIGTNGSGKSTLLRTLSGMQKALGGTIRINGKDLGMMSHSQRAKTFAIVLTERIDLEHTTARQLVMLGRTPYISWSGTLSDEDKAAVERAIEQTGIGHLADKISTELSDGERQRVMIARALAQDTPLLILDEPTSFLDLPNRIEIMRQLKLLAHKTGKAILMSTHELDLALHTADIIWLMQKQHGMTADTPQNITASGIMNEAFPSELFTFDTDKGAIALRYTF